MTVHEFAQKNGYKILSSAKIAEAASIKGVYVCDMLSHAMANIKDGDMWITVHTNINIVAVALLTNASCIAIPENISVDKITLDKAAEENITIISSPHSAYEICTRFYLQTSEHCHG